MNSLGLPREGNWISCSTKNRWNTRFTYTWTSQICLVWV